jgi:hypothetical protein
LHEKHENLNVFGNEYEKGKNYYLCNSLFMWIISSKPTLRLKKKLRNIILYYQDVEKFIMIIWPSNFPKCIRKIPKIMLENEINSLTQMLGNHRYDDMNIFHQAHKKFSNSS